jgi:hypothetical protein
MHSTPQLIKRSIKENIYFQQTKLHYCWFSDTLSRILTANINS